MSTSDPLDNEISDGCRIIFAFNPQTNELKYHGPTRNPDKIIDFESLCMLIFPHLLISTDLGPPNRVSISEGVTIFLYIISGLGALASIVYMIVVVKFNNYFRFQTPEFCIVCFCNKFSCLTITARLLWLFTWLCLCFAHSAR